MHPTPLRSMLLSALTASLSLASAADVLAQRAPASDRASQVTLLAKDAETRTRDDFLKLISAPRVDLAPEARDLGVSDGIKQSWFSFASEKTERVPGLWYQSAAATGKLPVVIIMHGTGGSKDGMKELLTTYAKAGFAAVAIDGRYHGERKGAAKDGNEAYQAAILRAYRDPGQEYPFFFDTAWDMMRLIDYLETRPEVDAKRIGAIGISKGGIEIYLAMAVEPRIAVGVPCIGVQSFRWALDNNSWHSRIGTIQNAVDTAAKEAGVPVDAAFIRRFYARVAPGIDGEFDGEAMLALAAPRPVLVINGDSDARTPMPGLMRCIERAQSSYAAAGAADRLKFLPQKDTAHKVTPAAHGVALEWFKTWLKPAAL